MKILTETEIYSLSNRLCKSLKTFFLLMLDHFEDAAIEYNAESEKMYMEEMEVYNSKMLQYEEQCKLYDQNVAREEAEFLKRLEEWEKNEESHKKYIENFNAAHMKEYIERKEAYERTTGKKYPYNPPTGLVYHLTRVKPTKKVYQKPIQPTMPTKRSEIDPKHIDLSFPSSGSHRSGSFRYKDFSADLSACGLTRKDLPSMILMNKIGYLSKENIDQILEQYRKELYRNHRENMECTRSEHFGGDLTSTERGLYGENWR